MSKIIAYALILSMFLYLPGCIGQEAETITETQVQTATETQIETVKPTTPPTEFLSPYIGSGKLDGKGIPTNFFTDIDVRKGFAYCMDWDTLIDDVFLGEAVQPATPIIEGLAYHNPDQVGYTLDLTKAEEHFKKAWNGEVWEKGFSFTITYNIGNEYRRVSSELIKRNAESLNEKFMIYVRGVPWPTFLSALVDGTGPMFAIGWLADYPDPHNFAHPFMHSTGDFAGFTHFKDPEIDDLIERGIRETDPAKRQEIYYELQRLYVEKVPSIPLYQSTARYTFQDWIQGWYHQPIDPGFYWYHLWKTPGAKNQDRAVVTTIGGPQTVDPAWSYDTASAHLIMNVYDPLIKFYVDPAKTWPKGQTPEELTQATDKFDPWLATEVPTVANGGISPDGLTYTFHLREGIKFTNGADMTAEDVEYSIERGMVMDRAGGPQWMFYEPLLGVFGSRDSDGNIQVSFEDIDNAIEVVDTYTVRFNLAIPYGPFLTVLAQCWGSVLDKDWAIAQGCWDGNPETWTDYNNPEVSPLDDPKHVMMGTGPFKFDHFDTEVEWLIVRNENFWHPNGPAYFSQVLLTIDHEWAARKLKMLAGDVDFCAPETIADAIELGKVEGITSIPGFVNLVCGAMFFNFDIQ
ncbi:MAG: ABC transporter substrate-binding protein [Candidatus Heimdallarchaeota archaeon]